MQTIGRPPDTIARHISHFEQNYVDVGRVLDPEDAVLEEETVPEEAENRDQEEEPIHYEHIQTVITQPSPTQTGDEWSQLFETFALETKNLENQYVNLAIEAAELERYAGTKKSSEAPSQVDIQQQLIDDKQKKLNDLKNQIFRRKYAERAFFDYFFRTGETLERIPELKNHIDKYSTRKLNQMIAKEKPEMQKQIENIDRLTEYITGLPLSQFLDHMEQICKKEEPIEHKDDKQKGKVTINR
jgi:uncharacterized protein YajQ (UPF0234 family)